MMRRANPEVFDQSQAGTALVADNSRMQFLRNATMVARFVLIWFALSLGVAIASPLVKPQPMEVICTGSGAMKVLVQTDEGLQELVTLSLDCPLCAPCGAPPKVTVVGAEPASPLAHVLRGIPAARLVSLTAAPLPARGPPLYS